MNIFIEGIQGSGKSTAVNLIANAYNRYICIREGDYSPIELAWCAYVNEEQYEEILRKYSSIRSLIENKTQAEGEYRVICYTQIITDIPGFHKDLEQYEIYNGRRGFEEFKSIIFKRYKNWYQDKMVSECALLQNIVEDMILYRDVPDDEIIEFYRELRDVLYDKEFKIIYLKSDNIRENIEIIRKERSDDQGNELWFPLMLEYFNKSPYALKRGLMGEDELISHFVHRQELELRICNKLFSDRLVVLPSKDYHDNDIQSVLG